MRISDWSSDVCSSDLLGVYGAADHAHAFIAALAPTSPAASVGIGVGTPVTGIGEAPVPDGVGDHPFARITAIETRLAAQPADAALSLHVGAGRVVDIMPRPGCVSDFRSEEHTSELQSLMRNSYAVFWLKKKNNQINIDVPYTKHTYT